MARKSTLPICECARCGGNAYPIQIVFGCEKCNAIYQIDVSLFDNIYLGKQNSKLITSGMINYLKLEERIQEEIERVHSSSCVHTEESCKIDFKGRILDYFVEIRNRFNFSSIMNAVKFIIEGFNYILKSIDSLPGDKIRLVDEFGNKSEDIMSDFFKDAHKVFNQEKDKETVNRFLDQISNEYKIEEMKKKVKNNEADED